MAATSSRQAADGQDRTGLLLANSDLTTMHVATATSQCGDELDLVHAIKHEEQAIVFALPDLCCVQLRTTFWRVPDLGRGSSSHNVYV